MALVGIAVVALPNVFATLSNSTFDAADGNLVTADTDGGGPDTADAKDWENIGINCTSTPKVGCGLDLPTGGTDNSFGQGTSEDDAVPTVVTGSIPNNKSDLTRLYVTGESGTDNHSLLYLGWERVQAPTGTTNMDFELNQSKILSSNGVTPVRTAGDVLVAYDLSQGGTTPHLSFHVWVTSGTKADCEKNGQTPPCWGPTHDFGTDAESSINTSSVTDPINPNAPRTLDPRTFGEAAVDLTDAGLVNAGDCLPFASAYLKSRSSDSFTSEIKDFIAPVTLSLSNCGAIKVTKVSTKGNTALAGATFEVKKPDGTVIPFDATHNTWTTGSDGTFCVPNVPIANGYTVQEKTAPTGYKIDNANVVTVNVTAAGDCTSGATQVDADPNTTGTQPFTDTPLSTIEVKFTSLAGTGVTTSQIVCKKGTAVVDANAENGPGPNGTPDNETTPVRDDTDEVFGNGTSTLTPGVYTCTIDVDP